MRLIKTLLISLITTLSFSQYSIPTNHFFVSKFASSFDIQYNKAPTWPRIELNQSWDLITLKESYQVYPYKKGYGTNVSNGQTDKIVYEGTKLPKFVLFRG